MVLEDLAAPIVLAPLAGGPSTPALCAAVSEAGGLGFLAAGYLSAGALRERIAATRSLTARAFGIGVFARGEPSGADTRAYAARLRRGGHSPLGEPRFDDDAFAAKLAVLADEPPAVVSFTFGCPPPAVIEALPAEVWVTVTSVGEARAAVSAGADALVVQGTEAGGHRGSWRDDDDDELGLLALLGLVRPAVEVPLVATGGLMTRAAVAEALAAGAAAAQCGSAFLLCPEAGTSPVHRAALRSGAPTALTRAFTGRLARGIVNRFMEEHSAAAPSAYPEVHHLTAPLRAAGRERGDGSVVNLWAGEAYALAREAPAADVVRALTP